MYPVFFVHDYIFFFLECAGELRIIALREEKTDPYKKPPPTPARAVGVLSYNKA